MSVKEYYKHFKQTKLPSLARFHFRVWHVFTSEFGILRRSRWHNTLWWPSAKDDGKTDDTEGDDRSGWLISCDDNLRLMTNKFDDRFADVYNLYFPASRRHSPKAFVASQHSCFAHSSLLLTYFRSHLLNPLHFFFIQKSRNQVFHVNGKKVV